MQDNKHSSSEDVKVLTDVTYPGGVGVKVTVEKIDVEGEPHWLWELCLKTEHTFHDHKSWITVYDIASEAEMDEYAETMEVILN